MQILDKNDPNYRYGPHGTSEITGYEYKGTSNCTFEELQTYVEDYWNGEYSLVGNNCQHFAGGLTTLLSNNCAEIRAYRPKRKRDVVLPDNLVAYFEQITTEDNDGPAIHQMKL